MKHCYTSNQQLRHFTRMITLLLMTSTLWCMDASAATYTWNGIGVAGGSTNTNFNTASNWLVGGIAATSAPGASDDVVISPNNFSAINSATITVSSSITVNSITCNVVFPAGVNTNKTLALSVAGNQTLTVSGDMTLSCVHNASVSSSALNLITNTGSAVVVGGTASIGDNASATGARLVKIGGAASVTGNSYTFNGNTTFGSLAATSTPGPVAQWVFSGASSQSLSVAATSTNFGFTNVQVGTVSIATALSMGSTSFTVSGNWTNYGSTTHSGGDEYHACILQ